MRYKSCQPEDKCAGCDQDKIPVRQFHTVKWFFHQIGNQKQKSSHDDSVSGTKNSHQWMGCQDSEKLLLGNHGDLFYLHNPHDHSLDHNKKIINQAYNHKAQCKLLHGGEGFRFEQSLFTFH